MTLTLVRCFRNDQIDAIGHVQDLAYDDQEQYLNGSHVLADYGEEWPEARERWADLADYVWRAAMPDAKVPKNFAWRPQ